MNVKNHCIGRKHLSVAKCYRQDIFLKKSCFVRKLCVQEKYKEKKEMIL